jgi:hypothetical protein
MAEMLATNPANFTYEEATTVPALWIEVICCLGKADIGFSEQIVERGELCSQPNTFCS